MTNEKLNEDYSFVIIKLINPLGNKVIGYPVF